MLTVTAVQCITDLSSAEFAECCGSDSIGAKCDTPLSCMGEMRKKTGLVGIFANISSSHCLSVCRLQWLIYPVGLHMLVKSHGYSTLQ